MKYEKAYTPVVVGIAVVVAAIAAVLVMNKRAAIARAKADEAESKEIAEDKRLKAAKAEAAALASKSAIAADDRRKLELENANKLQEKKNIEAAAAAAEKQENAARIEAENLAVSAKAASDRKAEAKLNADAERFKLERVGKELEISNAAVARVDRELETQRLKTAAKEAEKKTYELRKLDLDRIERELIEYKQDLDERERALHPDVSIYDSSNITWVADREAEVIGVDTNRLTRKVKVLPENDPKLPPSARELARVNRISHESATNRTAVSRAKILETLERLRDEARREGRVVDANYYQKSILSLYPDYQQ